MPTYNERLQTNNTELDQIKQAINNLPESGGAVQPYKLETAIDLTPPSNPDLIWYRTQGQEGGGDVPTKLATLNFTGAAQGSYDGTAPLTVNIPSGGGGDEGKWEIIKTIKFDIDAPLNITEWDDGTSLSLKAIGYKLKLGQATTEVAGNIVIGRGQATFSSDFYSTKYHSSKFHYCTLYPLFDRYNTVRSNWWGPGSSPSLTGPEYFAYLNVPIQSKIELLKSTANIPAGTEMTIYGVRA